MGVGVSVNAYVIHCKKYLDQGKNPKWPVSSHFHSSFLLFLATAGGSNPEGHLLTLT